MSIRNLVFLCVQNSARSQMAEAIARSLAPPTLHCWSAGSEPFQVRPQVPMVLGELGINSDDLFSKGLDAIPLVESTIVVTLCA